MDKKKSSVSRKSPYLITEKDLIADIVQKSPRAIELLAEYGLYCVSCPLNQFDNLETGSKIHGMTENETGDMIKEINLQLMKEAKDKSK